MAGTVCEGPEAGTGPWIFRRCVGERQFALCDGVEEPLSAGVCHLCPKGSEHAIVNTGKEDLCLLAVVVEH